VTERERNRTSATNKERLRQDTEFVESADIVGEVEAEASNATGGAVDPTEVDVMRDPELVRLGLRTLLRSLMFHLGPDETERAYEKAFGFPLISGDLGRLPTLSELRSSKGYGKREFARLTGSSTREVRPWEVREFARWLFEEGKQEDKQKEEPDE
jgi:hypothetical protein